MTVQIKRGLNADRSSYTPAAGELIATTDTKRVFLGDGTTPGGVDPFATDPYGDLYNVRLYGAEGDGVTNDTAALQDAIDAAEVTGGEVVFPPGDYALSTYLTVDSPNVTLRGMGGSSRIIASTASGAFVLKISAANVKVKDLTFVGGVSTEPAAANECIDLLSGAVSTEISGCLFTGTNASTGFNVQIRGRSGCLNPRIVNNHFERSVGTNSGYGYGIQIASVHGGVIANNVSVQSATQGRHHIYPAVDCTNLTIANNRLYGGTSAMITCYSTSTEAHDIAITGNTLDGLTTGGGTGGMIELVGVISGCCVTGNALKSGHTYGVKIESSSTTLRQSNKHTVSGNRIDLCGGGGVYCLHVADSTIVGNTISGCTTTASTGAIFTNENCIRNVITGNNIIGTAHEYGIRDSGVGNVIYGNRAAPGSVQAYRVSGVVSFSSSGSPEAVFTAGIGSTYTDTTGGKMYVKATGTGNTGWVALKPE